MSTRTTGGWLVAATLLLAGCGSGAALPEAPGPTASVSTPVAAVPSGAPPARPAPPADAAAPVRPAAVLAPSHPVGLVVPAIGVRVGPLLDLGIDREGALEVPPDARGAGWFELSPTPGAAGPAVIAAHVDYAGVPGVFARLTDLRPGDEVSVRRADGSDAVFVVHRVDRYPKSAFPSDRVYGNTAGAELRLITCGGVFDRGSGQYRDNVVAYARLVGTR